MGIYIIEVKATEGGKALFQGTAHTFHEAKQAAIRGAKDNIPGCGFLEFVKLRDGDYQAKKPGCIVDIMR